MAKYASVFAVWILTAASVGWAEQPQPNVAEQFQQLESRWMNALADKDTSTLESLLAPEFAKAAGKSLLATPASLTSRGAPPSPRTTAASAATLPLNSYALRRPGSVTSRRHR